MRGSLELLAAAALRTNAGSSSEGSNELHDASKELSCQSSSSHVDSWPSSEVSLGRQTPRPLVCLVSLTVGGAVFTAALQ